MHTAHGMHSIFMMFARLLLHACPSSHRNRVRREWLGLAGGHRHPVAWLIAGVEHGAVGSKAIRAGAPVLPAPQSALAVGGGVGRTREAHAGRGLVKAPAEKAAAGGAGDAAQRAPPACAGAWRKGSRMRQGSGCMPAWRLMASGVQLGDKPAMLGTRLEGSLDDTGPLTGCAHCIAAARSEQQRRRHGQQ
jgi:hypothetical protein